MTENKDVKDIYSISADELNHRMDVYQRDKLDPCQRAVAVLESAVDKVLKGLGVNIDDAETIPQQMNDLGIIMTENTEEMTPQLNGFFIFLDRNGDLIPHSWVGAARLDSNGCCYCDIQYFMDNRLDEVGGVKLIK